MAVQYKLESFEGPLDLLLHLIDQAKVDIYDIPIHKITNQYMEYMEGLGELELNVASEFVLMSSTLLVIKSKMLLPKPPPVHSELEDGEFEDPRAELVQKLIEYRKYKGIAEVLREKEIESSLIFSREPEDLTPYKPNVSIQTIEGLYLTDLIMTFQKIIRNVKRRDRVTRIHRDEVSVKDRMMEVVQRLHEYGGQILFSKLVTAEATREDVVVSFLALLELMKVQQIHCYQHQLFDDIVIQSVREETLEDGWSTDEISY